MTVPENQPSEESINAIEEKFLGKEGIILLDVSSMSGFYTIPKGTKVKVTDVTYDKFLRFVKVEVSDDRGRKDVYNLIYNPEYNLTSFEDQLHTQIDFGDKRSEKYKQAYENSLNKIYWVHPDIIKVEPSFKIEPYRKVKIVGSNVSLGQFYDIGNPPKSVITRISVQDVESGISSGFNFELFYDSEKTPQQQWEEFISPRLSDSILVDTEQIVIENTNNIIIGGDEPVVKKQNHILIAVNLANIRQGPGTEYNVIHNTTYGQEFTLLEKNGEWLKVELNSPYKEGWINSNLTSMRKIVFVEFSPEDEFKNSLVYNVILQTASLKSELNQISDDFIRTNTIQNYMENWEYPLNIFDDKNIDLDNFFSGIDYSLFSSQVVSTKPNLSFCNFRDKKYIYLNNIGLKSVYNDLRVSVNSQCMETTVKYGVEILKQMYDTFGKMNTIDGYIIMFNWGSKDFSQDTYVIENHSICYICSKGDIKKLKDYVYTLQEFIDKIFILNQNGVIGGPNRIRLNIE
jgi:hypothetical protein